MQAEEIARMLRAEEERKRRDVSLTCPEYRHTLLSTHALRLPSLPATRGLEGPALKLADERRSESLQEWTESKTTECSWVSEREGTKSEKTASVKTSRTVTLASCKTPVLSGGGREWRREE